MVIYAKARAKINWSLDIIKSREDGYHELDMLMQNIELSDDLRFRTAKWLTLTVNGRQLPVGGKNLVIRAANALNEFMGKRKGARIELWKRIPVRAGLGGGSADCAETLKALNKLWGYNLPLDRLIRIGASLGADVPFCLKGGFSRVSGIGENMESIEKPPRIPLVLVMPNDGLSTAKVFSEYDRMKPEPLNLRISTLRNALIARDYDMCASLSGNALEIPAISLLPDVKRAIDELNSNGAAFTRMTGSGSCVFGAFHTIADAMNAAYSIHGAIFTWSVGDID